jgi:methionyl aminopeptidase
MSPRQAVIHTAEEIPGIRAAAQAAAQALRRTCDAVRPGMSTLELDQLAGQFIQDTGGTSAFHGYHGYPAQICISINEEVVHGIGRADRIIRPGDLVSLDVGVNLNGFIGDNAYTVCAGIPPTPEQQALLDCTEQSLAAGIAAAKGGGWINDISRAIERVVTQAGFSVVRDFVGHGCGVALHEAPEVPNFAQRSRGPRLEPGMVLAIEPMVNRGTPRVSVDPNDKWTVRTADLAPSAHFEHMVLITKDNPEILTWPKTV